MRIFICAIMLSLSCVALAGDAIFTLTDPRGDDHGWGKMTYPLRDDLRPGSLDLVSLSASPDGEGTMFEAVFASPVVPTARRTIDSTGTSLDTVARFGFYTFNLDIYIDTDRESGMGSVEALPGRRAEIDPAHAWEKVVCLTPRPFETEDTLKRILKTRAKREMKEKRGSIDDDQLTIIEASIDRDVKARYFFPTRIRVIGPKIRFLVPAAFLGGQAKPSWGYVVAVSGADIQQRLDIPATLGLAEAGPESLMILPVSPGTWRDRFGGGYEDDNLLPPLIDIIVPEGKKQEEVLKDYDLRNGRRVKLPGVVPVPSH